MAPTPSPIVPRRRRERGARRGADRVEPGAGPGQGKLETERAIEAVGPAQSVRRRPSDRDVRALVEEDAAPEVTAGVDAHFPPAAVLRGGREGEDGRSGEQGCDETRTEGR